MRRLVAALLVAVLTIGLAGCGGGEETPPPAETAAPAPTTVSEVGKPVENPIPDRSLEETAVFEPFPTSANVPAAITERLADKQPMLILFVNGGQSETDDLQKSVNKVIADNKGVLDLITYDLGKYTSVSDTGTIEVEEKNLSADDNAEAALGLARELGLTAVPFIFLVDDQGYIIFQNRGYIDPVMLDRQVQRVSE